MKFFIALLGFYYLLVFGTAVIVLADRYAGDWTLLFTPPLAIGGILRAVFFLVDWSMKK